MHKEEVSKKYEPVEEIISNYYEKIYKYCYWQLKNAYTAQDATQETFFCLLKYYDKESEIKNINAYIYKIARNKCIDAQKGDRIGWAELEEMEDTKATSMIESVINKVIVEESLNCLKKDEKEMITLRYSQGLSIKEIAKAMEINQFNVQYRIKVALKRLNKIIKKNES